MIRFALVLVSAAFALPAAAQDTDCSGALETQFQMTVCSARDFEAADARLNDAWKQARTTARSIDADSPGARTWSQLLAGQRAWIQFRDGHCGAVAALVHGGTMQPMARNICLTKVSETRTQALLQFVRREF